MPNLDDRLPQNASGRFYVDCTCIDCDICRDDDIGFSVVFRQPVTDEEIQTCVEALEGCPTEPIGQVMP